MKEELKTEEYIVAFIDLLGSSKAIHNDPDGTLKTVHNAYSKAIQVYNEVFEPLSRELKIKIFSDNIIIYTKCNRLGANVAFHITSLLAGIIQINFLNSDLLSRGGISKGSFFSDDIMIWGEALVDAYNIESKISIYPRIVVNPKLISELQLFRTNKISINKLIVQDSDYLCFINYLSIANALKKNASLGCLKYLERSEDMKLKHMDDIKAVQKICWHQDFIKKYISALDIKE